MKRPSRRQVAIGTGALLSALTVIVTVCWLWWIPSAVRERLSTAAARRGLSAEVESVELGYGEVVLRGLQLESRDGLSVHVASVELGAGVFELASAGTGAIRRVRAEDVRLSADLDAPGFSRALSELRPEPVPGAEEASSDGRALEVVGLSVTLRDRRGVLIASEGGSVSVRPEGSLRIASGQVELAADQPDGVRVGAVRARLDRDPEHGWRVASCAANDVAIRYREREGAERSPIWARMRRHAERLRSLAGIEGADESSDRGSSDASRPEPAGGDAAEPPEPASAEPPEDTAAQREHEPEPPEASPGIAALLGQLLAASEGRLAPEAIVGVDRLSVTATSEGGERRVLRHLEAEVRVLPGGRYRLEGSGRPGRGGRLAWNLTIEPRALRAEGDLDFQRLPFVLVVPFLPALPWHHPEDTRISGELSIRGESAARLHLAGEVSVEDLALSSPRISPRPVRRIGLSLRGEADWIPADRRLELASSEIAMGGARANLRGSLEWPEDHYALEVLATLPATDCDTAVGAIPADLLADATAFTFTGRIGGQIVAQVDSRDLDAAVLRVDMADGCRFETAPAMADVNRFAGPFRHRVVEPDGTTFEMETGPGTLAWTPLSGISPFFVHAVLGHEDAGFFGHSGFAPHAIRLALIRNLRAGRYAFGASTITMQLVKNVFLHREKSLARKLQEVLLTWWTESVMEKARILELYLNVIEYGPAIYGIRHAAQHYFGRSPAELGPAESAYLATILPSPKRFHAQWENDLLPEGHRRRLARFLQTLGSRGRYDADAVARGLEELTVFDFYRPGDPLPREIEPRGRTAPLPIGADPLDAAWEEAMGPDDPFSADPFAEQPFEEEPFEPFGDATRRRPVAGPGDER